MLKFHLLTSANINKVLKIKEKFLSLSAKK